MSSPEPMPGSTEAPFISPAAQRMWERLPRIYRILDAQNGWAFKRYLGGIMSFVGELDTMTDRIAGSRPVGPASPEPWDLDPEDLARWRDARRDVNSALTDPDLAEDSWLPYIAQLLGVYLDPQSGLVERRDTIRFATTGYRGGTRAALADAARSALTGSRYVMVQPLTRGDGSTGTIWDVTLRTRASETPGGGESVIQTVIRKGAKPAGVRLWHSGFGTTWDVIEARFPTWTDWEYVDPDPLHPVLRTWDQLEEAGATYEVPENLLENPSFEEGTADWIRVAVGGGQTPDWAATTGGGVDGRDALRLTKVGATGGMGVRPTTAITDAQRVLPQREYIFSISAKPSVTVNAALVIAWLNTSNATISETTVAVTGLAAGEWNRTNMTTRHTSPAGTVRALPRIEVTGTVPAGTTVDLDAALFRLVTTTGG